MKKATIGFAMCGSFCTFSKAFEQNREGLCAKLERPLSKNGKVLEISRLPGRDIPQPSRCKYFSQKEVKTPSYWVHFTVFPASEINSPQPFYFAAFADFADFVVHNLCIFALLQFCNFAINKQYLHNIL